MKSFTFRIDAGRVFPIPAREVRTLKDKEANDEAQEAYDSVCERLSELNGLASKAQLLDQVDAQRYITEGELAKMDFERSWWWGTPVNAYETDDNGIRFSTRDGVRDDWGKDLARSPGVVVLEKYNSTKMNLECEFQLEDLELREDQAGYLPKGLVRLKGEKPRIGHSYSGEGYSHDYQRDSDGNETHIYRKACIAHDYDRRYVEANNPRYNRWETVVTNVRPGSTYESKLEINRDEGFLIYHPPKKVE